MGKCSICGYIGDCTTYALLRAVEKECGVSVAVTSCVYLESTLRQLMNEYDELDLRGFVNCEGKVVGEDE